LSLSLDQANSPDAAYPLDVKIHTREEAVRCHSYVLAAVSPLARTVMRENFRDRQFDLFLPDFSVDAVEAAVSFLYTGELWMTTRTRPEVEELLYSVLGLSRDLAAEPSQMQSVLTDEYVPLSEAKEHFESQISAIIRQTCEELVKKGKSGFKCPITRAYLDVNPHHPFLAVEEHFLKQCPLLEQMMKNDYNFELSIHPERLTKEELKRLEDMEKEEEATREEDSCRGEAEPSAASTSDTQSNTKESKKKKSKKRHREEESSSSSSSESKRVKSKNTKVTLKVKHSKGSSKKGDSSLDEGESEEISAREQENMNALADSFRG